MAPLRLLFVGDVVGEGGVETIEKLLPMIINEKGIDFCVVNAENSHEGRGTNEVIVKKIHKAGADVITGGDHSFDKHLIFPYMAKDNRLLRPMNYPKGAPGYGYGIYPCNNVNLSVGVLNLRGLSYFNNPIRCPFQTADFCIEQIQKETSIIFVDFHAEATAEKIALAYYLDGRVSAVAGTHTHVQTADERILPGGTGFITDVGFTGPHHSIIGMDIETALNRFLIQIPQKYKVATDGNQLDGVIFSINIDAEHPSYKLGTTVKVDRIQVKQKDYSEDDYSTEEEEL